MTTLKAIATTAIFTFLLTACEPISQQKQPLTPTPTNAVSTEIQEARNELNTILTLEKNFLEQIHEAENYIAQAQNAQDRELHTQALQRYFNIISNTEAQLNNLALKNTDVVQLRQKQVAVLKQMAKTMAVVLNATTETQQTIATEQATLQQLANDFTLFKNALVQKFQ